MEFVSILFCFAVGLGMLLKPRTVWKLDQAWKSTGGEPTQLYLKVTRVMGGGLMLLSLIMLVVFARV